MLTRIYTPEEDIYINAIELTWLVIVTEFIIAMTYIKIYDSENGEINFRRIFWYLAGAIPALFMILVIIAASLKVIFL